MVRLFMKQEFVSVQNRIIVKNESGDDIYLIVGKWGRLGDTLSLYDMSGNLLVEAKQTLLSVFPTFDLYIKGKKIGTLVKRPGIRQPYYRIKKLDWRVTGNFLAQQYTIREKTKTIMEFTKTSSYTEDFYSLKISEKRDAPLCCVLAVIIDHYSFNRKKEKDGLRIKAHELGFHQPLLGYSLPKKEEKEYPFLLSRFKSNSNKGCTH